MTKKDDLFSANGWIKQGGPGFDAAVAGHREIVVEFVQELLPYTAARIGITLQELEHRLLETTLLPLSSMNGRTYSLDNWRTFRIEINLGLMVLIHSMSKMFACNVTSEPDAKEKGVFSFKEIVSTATSWIHAFWRQQFVLHPSIDLARLNADEWVLSAVIRDSAERFVIAHELGHVVIKMKSNNVPEWERAQLEVRRHYYKRRGFEDPGQKNVLKRWTEEIAADLIGLDLCHGPHPGSFSIDHEFLGIETLLVMQTMLENVYERTNGRAPTHIYPPSRYRLDVLRRRVDDLVPQRIFSDIGRGMEKFSNQILDAMQW